MTDCNGIDANEVFQAVSKAGASKPDKVKPPKGIHYKPSTREKREALSRVLPIIKRERAERLTRRQGQQSAYDRAILDEIFKLMAEGLTCQDAQQAVGLPASTFADWLEKGGGDRAEALSAREAYARARLALADAAFSQALVIPRQLYAMAIGQGDNDAPVDSAAVQAGKLLTDTLKWYAERLAPAAYADKSKADVPVVNVTNNSLTISSRDLSPDQRAQLRELLSAASNPPIIEG